jgi:hypothetical protein
MSCRMWKLSGAPSGMHSNLAGSERIDSIAHQAAGCGNFAKVVHRGYGMARRQGHNLVAARVGERSGGHRERGDPLLRNSFVSPGWLRLLSDLGKVPCTRAGMIRLFKASDLDKLKAERAKRPK